MTESMLPERHPVVEAIVSCSSNPVLSGGASVIQIWKVQRLVIPSYAEHEF